MNDSATYGFADILWDFVLAMYLLVLLATPVLVPVAAFILWRRR